MENWRINDDKMSIADIAYHLLESDNWTIQKIKNPGLKSMVASANIVNIVSREEYDDILNRLEKILGEKILAVKNFTLWDFDKMIYDDRFGKEVNLWFMIMRGNIDHEIHHRGQLSAYLQLIG
ncbi:MAG: hypothetical protein JW995_10575 [Melioribacteraceae bacterium]|nr:hypothetical protein [Melioribacteraceae bacterium]